MENDITEETEEKETMTAQEAEEFLNEMRKVFSIVRILDQKNFGFTPVKDRSGASQAKAVNVNRNKKGIGLLVAGEKGTKTDWFKIRLTRKQKVTFTFTARANDHLRLQIVPADPKLFIWGSSIYAKSTTEKVSTKDAFPAGTYYIKISRMLTGDKDTSGYYSFSWR